ncbi:hypothetical protein JCM33374_g5721 [Metschnikowia sp. JCM 33374]|nr:hypothetical protein JCM33374_g5721 [Metschnikowia sp. JCM 33374]
MRNTKVIPLAVLSCLTVFVFFLFRHQEIFIGSAVSGIVNTQTNSAAPVSKTFIRTTENNKHLGYSKLIYSNKHAGASEKNSVLITSSIANENSFGKGRTFKDFYDVIGSLKYSKTSINISLYCGSAELLKIVTNFFETITKDATCPYNKVTILYAPFLQTNFKSSEHNPKVQRQRRRSIAMGRNFVLLNSLDREEFTLFLDADIIRFDHPDMLARFVKSEKDIIVPRIERGGSLDYDRNSWRGHRKSPSEEQLQLMNEDKWEDANFVPEDIQDEMFHLGGHVAETKDLPESDEKRNLSYLVDLDSVGGAVLFAKSIIYKQGVLFPTMNVVGTAWSRQEGFDGIETEGLCYVAKTLGYKCFAMPNLVAQHFNS